MKLTLYSMSTCPYCIKVLDEMDNIQLNGNIKVLDISDNKNMKDLVSLTGDYQVPCLVIDGKPMLESDDIIKFLRATFD